MKDRTVLLNRGTLDARVRELDLKLWWIAEQLEVDRKTVGRWLSGKVKRVQRENLVRLAGILNCPLDSLVLEREADSYAGRAEQSVAARLIEQENLLDLLAPSGKWSLLESLIKATLQPDLPPPLLGKLNNHLAIASWRQGKVEQAEVYARKALELGEYSRDGAVVAGARYNQAVLASFRGQQQEARRLYERCLEDAASVEDAALKAALLSNLGASSHEMGFYAEALEYEERAIAEYAQLDRPLNLAIAWAGVFLIHLETGRHEEATRALDMMRRESQRASFARGVAEEASFRSDLESAGGRHEVALSLWREGIDGFQRLGLREGREFEFGARVHRRSGDLDRALVLIEEGERASQPFPVGLMELACERHRIHEARAEHDDAAKALARADELARSCAAERRIPQLLATRAG